MFLPHVDVFCDLLLNRPIPTWNLLILVIQMNRKEKTQHMVQVRTKRTTQMQKWRNGRVSSDEGMRRRWRASASARTRHEGKDFSFVIHSDSFAFWCIVVKNKTNCTSRSVKSFFFLSSNTLFHSLSLTSYDNVINVKLIITREISFTKALANRRFDFWCRLSCCEGPKKCLKLNSNSRWFCPEWCFLPHYCCVSLVSILWKVTVSSIHEICEIYEIYVKYM